MRKLILLPAFAIMGLMLIQGCSDSPTDEGSNDPQQVAGFIVDEQAYRVPNALVELYTTNNTLVASDTTTEDGEFSLSAGSNALDQLRLRVTHSDFKAFLQNVSAATNGAASTDITLPLEHRDSACGQLSLLVRSDEGLDPLENVEVRLTRNGKLVTKAFTGIDGRLSFDYLIAGKYGLRFAKDGYKVAERSFTIQHCDTASFDIRMAAGEGGGEDSCCDGVLELVVKNEKTGDPIANAILKMWKDGAIVRDARSGENGVIRIGEICEGKYGFDLIREGFKHKEFQLTFGCSEVLGETIALTPAGGSSEDSCCRGVLTVTVVDKSTNTPVQNALVKLWREGQLRETGKTNAQGAVMMDGLCEGKFGISVLREGYKAKEMNVEFGCNDRKSVTFELEKAEQDTCCKGVLTLTVKEEGSGDPLPYTVVKLWRNGAIVESGKTDENGVVVIDGICEGEYGVGVLREGYKAREFSIGFGCSEKKSETVYLTKNSEKCCTASLKLRIIDDATEAWLQNATVVIKQGEKTLYTGTSDAEGWVLKEGLCAPAEYTVVIEMNGYQRKSFNVNFEECKRIQETVRLVTN